MLTRKELYNMFGWRTKRHLVVVESDDWGTIRMPSREVYDEFLRRGVRVDHDSYCQYDNLATRHDLENLFEVLQAVKDKNGHPAVITANTLSANPVFDKIKESGFTQYYFEPFTETLNHDAAHAGVFGMWKAGMEAGVFHPQSHGREHLYVKKWLRTLREGDAITRMAFDLGTWGLTSNVDPSIRGYYMGAFDSGKDADIREFEGIIDDALRLFHDIFGYESRSFTPTTYTWSPKIEPCLVQHGVRYIQSTFQQKVPLDDDQTIRITYRGFQGTRTKAGLIRLFRNCFFEPSTKPNYDWVGDCLRRIEIAFKWHKAANICAHRLNFIGSIDPANTDRNLPLFRQLLQEIVRRWPDVEFVSSDQLGKIIEESNQHLWRL
ncbi:MAG: hypothetical protein II970_03650 [Paludibacteraceae bacterium]|nr:hypothetical protein [Paludibacteraceae bacterium]